MTAGLSSSIGRLLANTFGVERSAFRLRIRYGETSERLARRSLRRSRVGRLLRKESRS